MLALLLSIKILLEKSFKLSGRLKRERKLRGKDTQKRRVLRRENRRKTPQLCRRKIYRNNKRFSTRKSGESRKQKDAWGSSKK